jgi:hypothetical protein
MRLKHSKKQDFLDRLSFGAALRQLSQIENFCDIFKTLPAKKSTEEYKIIVSYKIYTVSPGDLLPGCEVNNTPDVVRIEQNLAHSAHAQKIRLPDFQFLNHGNRSGWIFCFKEKVF